MKKFLNEYDDVITTGALALVGSLVVITGSPISGVGILGCAAFYGYMSYKERAL